MVPRKEVETPSSVHYEQFWGDDPYLICSHCDRIRDAMTGAVVREGNGSCEQPAGDDRG